MKTKIKETEFTFDQLSDSAKQKARDWWIECSMGDKWWDSTYEDAKMSGLEITGFDLDRSKHAEGKIENVSHKQCAKLILENHGDQCKTYNTALTFLAQYVLEETNTSAADEGWGELAEGLQDLCDQFLKDILSNYADMLQSEYEYLASDKAANEALEIGCYSFDEDGNVL